ncbi:MAG TPA: matrixin family metalloprotease [Thermoanaerobaculia bacterium]|nr:matrixin family metalloprotease [Thermoanaerobaculia bacterium]
MKSVALSLSLCLLCLLPLLALPAGATTFQMVTDSALTDQARAVVSARVVDVEPSTLGDRPATDYIVEVDRVLKGDVPGSTIVVRVPGGARPDGVGLKIWGAPEMAEGERALLFLAPRNDGTFRILQLMLGAFHGQTVDGHRLALRDLSEAQEVRPDGVGPAQDEVRDFDRFADWIADRAAGVRRDRDYLVAGSAGQPRSAVEAFTFMKGDDDNAIRWFEFDEGRSIAWRVNAGGQPGLGPDATIAAFNVALQAWDDDGGTNIRYTYAGTTSASTGFRDPDNSNTILFEDPGDNASEGSFDCGSGGVIAVGGPWFDDSTRAYKGKAYHQAVEADIVTNDGTSCFFDNNPKAAEEVFAHELGHTLGLGHSQTRDALMYARAHDDGRGARLTADDRAGIAELYTPGSGSGGGGNNGGGGSNLAAPANLKAVARSPRRVLLTWSDESTGETGFRIERSVAGRPFQQVASVAPNVTMIAIGGLNPGTSYRFRVRAVGANHARSPYSPMASVRTPRVP